MDNITNLFSSRGEVQEEEVKNFRYTLTYKDENDETANATFDGYFVVNALFAAMCEGEGNIKFLVPFERLVRAENLGPVGKTSDRVN